MDGQWENTATKNEIMTSGGPNLRSVRVDKEIPYLYEDHRDAFDIKHGFLDAIIYETKSLSACFYCRDAFSKGEKT